MSDSITQAFIQQFNSNVYALSQQRGSKTRMHCRTKTTRAVKEFFDRLAPTVVQEKTTRHADTPIVEQAHSRRAVTLKHWGLADLVDREDEIVTLISPASEYAQNFARSMGRHFDVRLIGRPASLDAGYVGGLLGQAEEGQFGGTFVPFPAANTLASGGVGLTVGRVRQVKRIFDAKDVREDGRVALVSAQAMEDLLEQTEVTSTDYNTVKALVQGTIEGDMWMGFQWVRVSDDILPIDTNLDRSCVFYQKDGVGMAMAQEMRTEMDRRADKWNALQVLVTSSFDAVRIDDDAVLHVLVRESA